MSQIHVDSLPGITATDARAVTWALLRTDPPGTPRVTRSVPIGPPCMRSRERNAYAAAPKVLSADELANQLEK
jgi:hypothetical protein